MTITTTIEREDEQGEWQEIELTVKFGYNKDRLGCPLEPDEPECVDITQVTDSNGNVVELTNSEQDEIEEKCIEAVCDAIDDAKADASERRHDW